MFWGIISVLLVVVGLSYAGWILWTHFVVDSKSTHTETYTTVTIGGISDTFKVTTTPVLYNKSAHSSLTSTCRTETRNQSLVNSVWKSSNFNPPVEELTIADIPPGLQFKNSIYKESPSSHFIVLGMIDHRDYYAFLRDGEWRIGWRWDDAVCNENSKNYDDFNSGRVGLFSNKDAIQGYELLMDYIRKHDGIEVRGSR